MIHDRYKSIDDIEFSLIAVSDHIKVVSDFTLVSISQFSSSYDLNNYSKTHSLDFHYEEVNEDQILTLKVSQIQRS